MCMRERVMIKIDLYLCVLINPLQCVIRSDSYEIPIHICTNKRKDLIIKKQLQQRVCERVVQVVDNMKCSTCKECIVMIPVTKQKKCGQLKGQLFMHDILDSNNLDTFRPNTLITFPYQQVKISNIPLMYRVISAIPLVFL